MDYTLSLVWSVVREKGRTGGFGYRGGQSHIRPRWTSEGQLFTKMQLNACKKVK